MAIDSRDVSGHSRQPDPLTYTSVSQQAGAFLRQRALLLDLGRIPIVDSARPGHNHGGTRIV